VFSSLFLLLGRSYLCNSDQCLNAAHDQYVLIAHKCEPEDMCFPPRVQEHVSSKTRGVLVARPTVSPVERDNIAPSPSPTHIHKIDIDLSGSSESADWEMDSDFAFLQDNEEFKYQRNSVSRPSNETHTSLSYSPGCTGKTMTADVGVQTNYSMTFKVTC
jgi:hypothetical protein